MQMHFCALKAGWFSKEVNGANGIPEGARPVAWDKYVSLLGRHVVGDENGDPVIYVAAPPTVTELRDGIKAAVTNKRYEVECGGIVLLNGIKLDTRREDQAAIANAIAVWSLTGLDTISFKAASGFVTLTFEELKQLAAAVGLHKQACYNAERVHHVALDARSTIDYLNEYDYSTGWPPNT